MKNPLFMLKMNFFHTSARRLYPCIMFVSAALGACKSQQTTSSSIVQSVNKNPSPQPLGTSCADVNLLGTGGWEGNKLCHNYRSEPEPYRKDDQPIGSKIENSFVTVNQMSLPEDRVIRVVSTHTTRIISSEGKVLSLVVTTNDCQNLADGSKKCAPTYTRPSTGGPDPLFIKIVKENM